MTTEQNIETAKQMYDAFGRGDVQAILDRVTNDVDWSTDAAIETLKCSPRIAPMNIAVTKRTVMISPVLNGGPRSRHSSAL